MSDPITPERAALLTAQERERLTFWKWVYMLKADGWPIEQARRLVFCRVLYQRGRLVG